MEHCKTVNIKDALQEYINDIKLGDTAENHEYARYLQDKLDNDFKHLMLDKNVHLEFSISDTKDLCI